MKIKLNKVEALCKQYYEKYGMLNPGVIHTISTEHPDNISENMHALFLETIHDFQENMLIPKEYNVWVLLSPRYMPVFEHAHDFIEFIYVYNTSCDHYVNEKLSRLKEGDLFILPPHVSHRIVCTSDDCLVFHIMVRKSTFNMFFLSLLTQDNALSSFFANAVSDNENRSYLRFKTDGDDTLHQLAYHIYKETLDPNPYTAITLDLLFQAICLNLIKKHLQHLEVINIKNEKDTSFIVPILNYIAVHYQTLTIEQLADTYHYSPGHMQRLITKHTKQTFHEIITNHKLTHAIHLLKTTDQSITQISQDCGFCEARSFQRAFRQRYSISASEYRKYFVNNYA